MAMIAPLLDEENSRNPPNNLGENTLTEKPRLCCGLGAGGMVPSLSQIASGAVPSANCIHPVLMFARSNIAVRFVTSSSVPVSVLTYQRPALPLNFRYGVKS